MLLYVLRGLHCGLWNFLPSYWHLFCKFWCQHFSNCVWWCQEMTLWYDYPPTWPPVIAWHTDLEMLNVEKCTLRVGECNIYLSGSNPKVAVFLVTQSLTQFSEWRHSHYFKLQALDKILLFPILYLLYLYILKKILFLSPDQEPLLMRCNLATWTNKIGLPGNLLETQSLRPHPRTPG